MRAHGTKRRKGTNTKFGKTDVGRFENREGDQPGECWINLNPIIGRTDSPGKREDTCYQKANKRSAGDATLVVSVPKHRRSSSGHGPFKFSHSGPLKAYKEELHEERTTNVS